jgi:hypothetical protein
VSESNNVVNGLGHVIAGKRLTCLISNAHRLLKGRYRQSPLWALVSDLTGNGSTTSVDICRAAGFDPSQPCGSKYLKTIAVNHGAES